MKAQRNSSGDIQSERILWVSYEMRAKWLIGSGSKGFPREIIPKEEANRMKVEKIECVLIGVKDLEKATEFFSDLFETEFSRIEFKEMDTANAMDPLGIELVAPLTPDGQFAETLERRGEGLMMLGLKVPDLEEAIAEMKSKGIRQVGEIQRGKVRTALFHPKDTFGVMIELIEYKAPHPEIPLLVQ